MQYAHNVFEWINGLTGIVNWMLEESRKKEKKRKRDMQKWKGKKYPEAREICCANYLFVFIKWTEHIGNNFFCLHTNTYFSGPCSFIAISSFFLLFQLNEHNHSHQQIQITRYHCCWKMDMIKVKIRGCKTSMYQILWKRKLNEVNKTDGMHDVFGQKKRTYLKKGKEMKSISTNSWTLK